MTEATPRGASGVRAELDSALSSSWAKYTGSRPGESRIEVEGCQVRWIVPDEFSAASTDDTEGQPSKQMSVATFERETSAAVRRATGRAVNARIRKLDKKTGENVDVFILADIHVRN